MASSTKSAPEKKTEAKKKKTEEKKKKASKGNDTKRRKEDKKKTSNGGVGDGEVLATPYSSSDSQNDVKNGAETIQKPTGGKNSKKDKQKAKREGKEEKEDAEMNRFPMERVRRIIRSEDTEMRITNEAVYLVNKATEMFLEKFCEEAYECCVQDRKKSLAYKHLSSVVSKRKKYDFLSDFVPEKVKAEDALAERKLMEPETAE